jgi:hypothetical protein
MTATLGAMLRDRAGEIAGRGAERALLGELLAPDGPVVAYVHGLAGVGKSTLVRAFAADARAAGAAVVELDAHTFYASQGELLAAVAGGADAPPTLEQAVAALAARGEQVVLWIDGVELLRVLDDWLCRTFVPALPAHVRLVLAGRDAPAERWRAYGRLLRGIALGNLPPGDAIELLERDGADRATARGINMVARGHPLSLQLAAWALRDRPGLAIGEVAAGAVGEELARAYLDGLDAPTRRALDAAALTRRTTRSLLEAMLPDDDGGAYERLRALPFVTQAADGLVVHDTVREATAALLRAADPSAYWRLRAAAWSRLRSELRGAPPRELHRYTADVIYLIENPAVRHVFFPPAAGEHGLEPAGAADAGAIARLSGEPELARAWFEAVPEAFVVARDGAGAVTGFSCLSEPQAVPARLLDGDPLATAWRSHLRGERLPGGQSALFLRWIRATGYEAGAALLLEATRVYMERRPQLRRVYARAADFADVDATCSLVMGYLPLADEPRSVCVDFGPSSVDGWLTELGERERLAVPGDARPPGLTRLEAEVLGYLQGRESQVVERAALLRDVWGYDWTGGSNVVEVVVSALRRKLGPEASRLETVRGVGYRLRAAPPTPG